MKKRIAVALFLALGLGGVVTGPSHAVDTPVGTITVNEGGYVVVADGNADNADPADGFISVSQSGQACADDNGTADDGNADNGPESDSATCTP